MTRDTNILAALKTCAEPHAVLMGQLIASTQQVRRACRADVASILRVARVAGFTVDCGDKILTIAA